MATRKSGRRSRRRSGGGRNRLVEALLTGLVLAVVAGAGTWWLTGLMGMASDSWHSGLVTGMAAGLTLAVATGAAIRAQLRKVLSLR